MKDEDLIYLFTGTSEIFIKNRMNRINYCSFFRRTKNNHFKES